jgi:hypothetical protein
MFIATRENIYVSKHFPTGNKVTVRRSWAVSKPEGCTVETRKKWHSKWLTCNQLLFKGRSSSNLQQTIKTRDPVRLDIQLTPRNIVLLEKLTVPQLGTKFLAFYATRRLITAFATARHLSLS